MNLKILLKMRCMMAKRYKIEPVFFMNNY
jgi:hypothetical protein